ncbi:aspartate aminotransferase family protein [Streptomyces coffeae]|uniref:Aminotransferase class III-fold pyridoxal phosphate-dependent enzyme n=1 Tax=Streptomyces coffeae TaxID=621382 RepID=A0ABS1NRS9_9ACTN|nr:aminotransferase class III-fold pyridoxal phosphate-dependent enzyme [Streptomyces coffeae]MBL1102592.1 aminotransferase class III-fold pyridoxal phosphate-dependent enzyme [Streptomyces coffeae]
MQDMTNPPSGRLSRLTKTLEELVAEYRDHTPRSAAVFQHASTVMPGGETRSVTYYPPYPIVLSEGHGAHLLDVDGTEYLDLVNNYTSLIHGNAYRPAVQAATAMLTQGAVFASPHERQLDLAELLTARLPAVEQVRFTNSGTEASLLAARLAQRATGRTTILLFDGAYHGSTAPLLADDPNVVTVPYNDLEATGQALTQRNIAAVFAEPFLGAGGVIPGTPEFLQGIADQAREFGALFVLDEVQSLRNSFSGEQGLLDLRPDITVLGKVIGGGMPIGAIGGREDLMSLTAATTKGHIAHSGTFNGHLTAAAAGAVTLRHLDEATIAGLNLKAARLADDIRRVAAHAGIDVQATRAGSILNVHFTATAPVNAEQARAVSSPLLGALHLALLREGIYTTPRGMINLSTALDADDLSRVTAAYSRAFQRLADPETQTPHQ